MLAQSKIWTIQQLCSLQGTLLLRDKSSHHHCLLNVEEYTSLTSWLSVIYNPPEIACALNPPALSQLLNTQLYQWAAEGVHCILLGAATMYQRSRQMAEEQHPLISMGQGGITGFSQRICRRRAKPIMQLLSWPHPWQCNPPLPITNKW